MRARRKPYTVFVDDNFHYMDESERYTLGHFATYEKAVAAAKRIVDKFLAAQHKRGMSAEELLKKYKTFGQDPYIVPNDREPGFSAWTYAEERCRSICD